MKKILVTVFVVYLGLVLLMPKEQLIYTLLNKANKQFINFEIANLSDFGVYENIDRVTVIYDKMKVAKIENIKILPLVFYNKVFISSASADGHFASMLDFKVYKASVSYKIFMPFKVDIESDTSVGKIVGVYDLHSAKMKLFLKPNNNFKNFKYKSYFRKQKGGYVYETIIK